jgi:hypothetical protein
MAKRLAEVLQGVGLLQEARDSRAPGFLDDFFGQIARAQNDGNVGRDPSDAPGEIDARHPRHVQIGDDDIEAAGIGLEQFESRERVGEPLGLVTEASEHPDAEIGQQRFVVEIQNALAAACADASPVVVVRLQLAFDGGEVELEARSLARLARHPDYSVMPLHDAVYHGKPEAGPAARFLGGEEGLEDPFQDPGVHSVSIVVDAETGITSSTQFRQCGGVIAIHHSPAQLDFDPAVHLSDRVPGVRAEIEKNLVNLGAIRENIRDIGFNGLEDLDLRRNRRPEQSDDFLDDR